MEASLTLEEKFSFLKALNMLSMIGDRKDNPLALQGGMAGCCGSIFRYPESKGPSSYGRRIYWSPEIAESYGSEYEYLLIPDQKGNATIQWEDR